MTEKGPHITDYKVLAGILLVLLFLTLLTISITSVHLASLTVAIALVIACVKGFLVLTYFMHLKYESTLLRVLVAMIFLLFAVIVLITFIDYSYR